jgi:cold shock CspA family protein
MVVRGKVVSFDRIKGYGFVASEAGGDDVFLHVNDLLDDKSLLMPGSIVEYVLEDGDRGPKASSVSVITSGLGAAPSGTDQIRPESDGDDLCDVLAVTEFEHEISETLLQAEPTLTGAQILDVRARMTRLAQSHGWVER